MIKRAESRTHKNHFLAKKILSLTFRQFLSGRPDSSYDSIIPPE